MLDPAPGFSTEFCIPPTQNPAPATPQVDKNNALLSIFVYHRLKIRTPRLPKQTKNGLFCLILSTPAPTEPQAEQTMLSTFLRPMQCNDIASTCSAFSCKKAESPLHPRKFRIDHPNVPYLTTITEQGAF